jgi:hypothetical protein
VQEERVSQLRAEFRGYQAGVQTFQSDQTAPKDRKQVQKLRDAKRQAETLFPVVDRTKPLVDGKHQPLSHEEVQAALVSRRTFMLGKEQNRRAPDSRRSWSFDT